MRMLGEQFVTGATSTRPSARREHENKGYRYSFDMLARRR